VPVYRFRFLDKSGRVIAGHYSRCENDGAARAYADGLAVQTGNSNIEISRSDRPGSRETPEPLRSMAIDDRQTPSVDRRKKVRRWGLGLRKCPRCESPDLFVIRLPIVRCLTCSCAYECDVPAAVVQPADGEQLHPS